jgi:hypothetical protein
MKGTPTMAADIDIEWGGEHVYVVAREGTTEVSLSITPENAAQIIPQLEWAIREVAFFGQWQANGKDSWAYRGKPKPGRIVVGGENGDK